MMNNRTYYQSKNPIACIAFVNWCYNNFAQSITKDRKSEKLYFAYLGKATELFGQGYYTTTQLYKIWEELEVDKSLQPDETDSH